MSNSTSMIDEIEGMARVGREPGLAQAAAGSLFVVSLFGVLCAAGTLIPAAAIWSMGRAVWGPLLGFPELDFVQAYFLTASFGVVGVAVWIPVTLIGHAWRIIAGQAEQE